MRVIVVEPGYSAYVAYFKNIADATAQVIRGNWQTILPFDTEKVAVLCAENTGKQPFNRHIDENTVINGRFIICGWDGKHPIELDRKKADRYIKRYLYPERLTAPNDLNSVVAVLPRARPTDERLGSKHWFMER